MEYIKLVLKGYRRLMLKNIGYFEFNPSDPVQLILGTNGSGKSSIIAELSPLPANAIDYMPDGYKEIHIRMGSDIYVCRSSFSPKQHHSITKNDDPNLNQGGTITVQRELVSQIFNVTQDLQDLMTGQVRFTRMSPSDKRYWFTRLSNTNYEYAIKTYNKLRDKYRDITGTVKTLKKRLVQETEKIVDIDYQSRLEKEVDEIHKLLSMLLEIRKPLEETKEELEQQKDKLYTVIAAMTRNIILTVNDNPGIGLMSYESLDSEIQEALSNIRVYEVKSDEYMERIKKLDDSIYLLEKTQGNSIEELTRRMLQHQVKQAEVNKLFTIEIDNQYDSNTLHEALAAVKGTLADIATNLVPNPDRYISRATYQEANKKIEELTQARNTLQTRLNALQARKQHQEIHRDAPAIKCPKCSHSWHLNYTEESYNSIVSELETIGQELHANDEEVRKTREFIESMQRYFTLFNTYTSLIKNWQILKPLWDYIESNLTIFNNPSNLLNAINEFSRNIDLKKEYDLLTKEVNEALSLIDSAEKVGNQDMSKLKEEREHIDGLMYSNSDNIRKARQKVSQLQTIKSNKKNIDEMKTKLFQYIGDSENLFDRTNEAIRREIFNDCVRAISTTLSRKEMAISEIRGQRSIISDIENQISLLTSDEASLKLLVQEMSPTDGLIAEGLYGFIKAYINQMNTFITKVWTYPLVIQACNVEDGGDKVDLDYKFPVHNPDSARDNSSYVPVPDVSKSSTGQKEIIDLAFMIIAMIQSGLGKAPVMLDEFAANMDNSHRISAISVVKSLIEQYSFTQLFMVNHYEGIYGAFTNAQMTVLCPENVIIPRDCVYNRHVVIE